MITEPSKITLVEPIGVKYSTIVFRIELKTDISDRNKPITILLAKNKTG